MTMSMTRPDEGLPSAWQRLFGTSHPVVLVTGSTAPRVGQSVLRHFAQLGCHVVAHGHRTTDRVPEIVQQLEAEGRQVLAVSGPVESETAVRAWIDQIVARFGRLDICVNSAAIWQPQRLEAVSAQDVQRYLEVNVLGSFLVAQKAGLQMVSQPHGGVIINIGDWSTVRPYPDHAAYFPSKGAVEAMTRSLAVEFAERNPKVRVNAILPGPVLFADDVTAEQRQATADACLLRRTGSPEHIALAAEFFVRNDFVTGVCLPVDGGRSIYAAEPLHTRYRTG